MLEYIIQSQALTKASNMKYTQITADAGAAGKFFQVIWNNSVEFAKVIIHLGDLHAFMEFFGVIGKLVCSSCFEDVIYQADMCTSGNVKGVLSGKHYNKAWVLNECFAEAIDRLFCEKYVEMPTEVEKNLKEMTEEITPDNIESSHSSDTNIYEDIVNKAKNDCLAGAYGKTPKFWMKYVSAVERHSALRYQQKHVRFATGNVGRSPSCMFRHEQGQLCQVRDVLYLTAAKSRRNTPMRQRRNRNQRNLSMQKLCEHTAIN